MSSSPTRRRSRPSAAVYRRRRLMVLLLVLVVVAATVLAIWQPWRGSATEPEAPAGQGTQSATPAPRPSTAAPTAATPTPGATDAAAATPAPDATASDVDVEPCSARSVSVVGATDKESYGADELPQLSISLTNNGEEPCLLNVGTSTQKFVITSGSDTWWQSTDCQSESSDQVVQIDPGQTVASASPLTWDRTRSSVDSCDGDRAPAPSGYFNLAVEIGGLAAHQTRQFVLG